MRLCKTGKASMRWLRGPSRSSYMAGWSNQAHLPACRIVPHGGSRAVCDGERAAVLVECPYSPRIESGQALAE